MSGYFVVSVQICLASTLDYNVKQMKTLSVKRAVDNRSIFKKSDLIDLKKKKKTMCKL